MGYVQKELAEPSQVVKGMIIGSDNSLRIKRALVVTMNIEFFKYQISFKLIKQYQMREVGEIERIMCNLVKLNTLSGLS